MGVESKSIAEKKECALELADCRKVVNYFLGEIEKSTTKLADFELSEKPFFLRTVLGAY